ncbi:MAG TPA: zinc ribbon domain-containing protein [Gemmataceae bacterium]|jgi:putative FmdB family regulatory protein|nr:zinc ribbon domain-containing protein [Gemmataceae bacterium]
MPIYEYACRKCDHTFEALVQNGETVSCPHCHAKELERLLSLPARPTSEVAESPCMADPSLPPCGPMCRRAR